LIRILIADDHPIVRKGLRMAIQEEAGVDIVAEAADGVAALELIELHRPRIAVLDIDMPRLDGFGVARELRKRNSLVDLIFLTMHAQEDLLLGAMELGAKGYILKDSALLEIGAAIRAVASGKPYLNSDLTARLLHRQTRPAPAPSVDQLTPTELRILHMVAEDKSSKEIGAALAIHYRTVENHRTNICRKLGLEGPNALLRFALKNKESH